MSFLDLSNKFSWRQYHDATFGFSYLRFLK